MMHADQGTSRSTSFRANYEASLGSIGNVIRRRGGIGSVLKTLGIAKVEPDMHVSGEMGRQACALGARVLFMALML